MHLAKGHAVADSPTSAEALAAKRVAWLLVAGIALAGLNLRIAVTSLGPVLEEVTSFLGMSAFAAGALTTLPVLCFAFFGSCTPALIRAFGEHRVLLGGLLAIAAGLGTRPFTDAPWAFMALSALALSGGAVGNVVLPTLIKRFFPHSVGRMTALYTTSMAVGTAGAAAVTVPAAEAAGGNWRIALAFYAVFAAAAMVPWSLALRREPPRADPKAALSARRVLGTAMGWQSVLFFGSQSAIAYILFGWYPQLLREGGMSATEAGLALSYLVAIGVPLSLVIPGLAVRFRDQRVIVLACSSCYIIALLGLWAAPAAGAWIWTTLLGLGLSTFPLALTQFAVRTRTAPATAALAAVSQSLGYLIGGAGPLLVGVLRGATGGWEAPIALLGVFVAANLAAGLLIGRPRYLEDALEAQPGSQSTAPMK